MPVDGRVRGPQRPTGGPGADERRELIDRLLDHRSVLVEAPLGSSSSPKSAETLPCTSITRLVSDSSVTCGRRSRPLGGVLGNVPARVISEENFAIQSEGETVPMSEHDRHARDRLKRILGTLVIVLLVLFVIGVLVLSALQAYWGPD